MSLPPSPPGIDLMDMASDLLQPEGDDAARISWHLRGLIARYQETFTVIEKVTLGGWQGIPPAHLSWASPDPAPPVTFQCPKPVIAAIHGGCIGGGESVFTTIQVLSLAGCLLAAALLPQPMASSLRSVAG